MLLLLRFLISLQKTGRAELVPPDRNLVAAVRAAGEDAGERQALDQLLLEWHQEALRELPGHPLAYHAEAAKWGAQRLFRAACFLSFREIEVEEISRALPGPPLPDADRPEAHFSADLSLRHWPSVFRMARALAEDDPLVKAMREMTPAMPLSAAGIPVVLPAHSPVFDHPGLCQLLAERAFAGRHRDLLSHPRLRALAMAKLGHYAEDLAPGLFPPSPVTLES